MRRFLIFLLVFLPGISFSQRPLPELWGVHVHDEAHVLSKEIIDHLENQLHAFEDSTSNQIAILIIPSLEGEVLEEYAFKVAEKWKLGQQNKDNGVLLLIAVDDHKIRIEVGYGLEGVLTDALSNRIIRNEIAPRFRENDYNDGVKAAINAIIAAIGGEYTSEDVGETGSLVMPDMSWQERLMIGAFVFGILGIFTVLGLFVPGCAGWFLYAFLIPFYATFPMFILGINGGVTALITYAIVFPILKITLRKTQWGKSFSEKLGKGGRGGSTWSSGSGWSSGGSSSSGGGFSGGGGSFGGGGSSGSW